MSNEAKLGDSVLNPNIFSNLQDGTKSKSAEANDSPREQVEPFGDTFQHPDEISAGDEPMRKNYEVNCWKKDVSKEPSRVDLEFLLLRHLAVT